jgi:hypothetical protein
MGPRSDSAKPDGAAGAGRASKVMVIMHEVCSGWQISSVNSGWLGPDTTVTPALRERPPTRMAAAIIELRARSSNFENKCRIALYVSLEQAAGRFKSATPRFTVMSGRGFLGSPSTPEGSMLAGVLLRGDTEPAAEDPREMALIAKTQVACDLDHAQAMLLQQLPRLLDSFPDDELMR